MPPRLSSSDPDKNLDTDDYQWAEFNLPPVLRAAAADADDPVPLWPVNPGLG